MIHSPHFHTYVLFPNVSTSNRSNVTDSPTLYLTALPDWRWVFNHSINLIVFLVHFAECVCGFNHLYVGFRASDNRLILVQYFMDCINQFSSRGGAGLSCTQPASHQISLLSNYSRLLLITVADSSGGLRWRKHQGYRTESKVQPHWVEKSTALKNVTVLILCSEIQAVIKICQSTGDTSVNEAKWLIFQLHRSVNSRSISVSVCWWPVIDINRSIYNNELYITWHDSNKSLLGCDWELEGLSSIRSRQMPANTDLHLLQVFSLPLSPGAAQWDKTL